MFELRIENAKGKSIKLTQNEDKYQVINIEGLSPPNALITSSTVAGMDGAKPGMTKLEPRNVVILLRLNGNVEVNRIKLYQFTGTKQWVKVYYKNGTRDVYAEGYIETNEVPYFTNNETMQVSIVCHDPYWKALNEIVTDISQVLGMFTFPFAFGALGIEEVTITDDAREFSTYTRDRITNVINEGEDETGVVIEITASGTVVNPSIYNVDTREEFGLNLTLIAGDVIIINTNSGQKSVRRIRDAVDTNQINKLVKNSTWFTLGAGDNQFTYSAESGAEDMHILFKSRTKYKGV